MPQKTPMVYLGRARKNRLSVKYARSFWRAWLKNQFSSRLAHYELCRQQQLLSLELCRRQIAQRGVQAFLVIDTLDELAKASLCISEVKILGPINLLVLQRLHERFRLRVVVRVTAPAHADQNLV